MGELSNNKSIESKRRGRRYRTELTGREALLIAAMKWFSRIGYEGVGLRTIAADAGVDIALVSRLFGSKAQLWIAVIDYLAECQEIHREQLMNIYNDNQLSLQGKLSEYIKIFVDISFEMPELSSFLMLEIVNPGERLAMINKKLIHPFVMIFQPLVEECIENKIIHATDASIYLRMLFSGISMSIISAGISEQSDERCELKGKILANALKIYIK
jgi:AcrR family transcriptional regulator